MSKEAFGKDNVWEKTSFFLSFGIITLIMVGRAFFGIDFTDEAYYLAEGRTVLEGNVPFAFNNSTAVGMTMVMSPFVRCFKLFSPNYEGYAIFMRLCFIAYKTTILLIAFPFLKRCTSFFCASMITLLMSAYHIYSIQNFSYNTISALNVYLVGVLLLSLYDSDIDAKKKNYLCFLAGVLSGIAGFAHPAHAFTIMLFLVLLVVFRSPVKQILLYILGTFSLVTIYVTSIVAQSSWLSFWQGFAPTCKGNLNSVNKMENLRIISVIWEYYHQIWSALLVMFVFVLMTGIVIRRFRGHGRIASLFDELWRGRITIVAAVFVSLIAGLIRVSLYAGPRRTMWAIGACGFFAFIIVGATCIRNKGVWFLGAPFVLFCVIEMVLTKRSIATRFVHVIPALSVLFVVHHQLFFSVEIANAGSNHLADAKAHISASIYSIVRFLFVTMLPLLALCAIVACQINSLRWVYRDAPLSKLTQRVEKGVFKGIYTTPQRAKDTLELEQYVNYITDENSFVAFRDNIPAGYLFMRGHICDIMTWDCMQYGYSKNDPTALYAYYDRVGHIPDIIIYVEHNLNHKEISGLSIDNPAFLYNKFISANYMLISDMKFNFTFKRVVVFKRIYNISHNSDHV